MSLINTKANPQKRTLSPDPCFLNVNLVLDKEAAGTTSLITLICERPIPSLLLLIMIFLIRVQIIRLNILEKFNFCESSLQLSLYIVLK